MNKYLLIGLVFASTILLNGCGMPSSSLPLPEAQQKIENFINGNLLSGGAKVTIKKFTEEYGLYKMIADPGNGQEITSYLTRDGKLFFPQALSIENYTAEQKAKAEAQNAQQANQLADITKTEKPVIELFVMSYCPYGTQIEKGFLPVVQALGDKIDFQLKFVDYAMHEKKEVDENLTQYCIEKEQPSEFMAYLGCFLKEGKSPECLDEIGIDKDTLESCIAESDKEYGITASYEDKSTWKGNFPLFSLHEEENKKYGVQGSPTLVINGKQVQTARDPQSLMKAVCAGFEDAPEECATEFPSDSPSTGFGFGTGGSDAAAAACATN